MAVVINNFDVTAQAEHATEARGGAPAKSGKPLDADDFVAQYGTVLREFIRNEIERHLRNVGD